MRQPVLAAVRDPEDSPASSFNAHEWAKGHEALDDFRFRIIFAALGVAVTCLIGAASWSIKAQYDSMETTVRSTQQQLAAISAVQRHVDTAVAPALSNSGQ